ncbi:unnamed protein product [Musa acuminata subsp. malaccensis]|uniref:protein-disulfide reductase n=1 Tax=Musa acuminata subsp. malaccensis TaxID=214687 RepID=A0A804I3M3_MUSAM|nr:unnamed protein product [Musa acuminata subsp. malaccensis]
MDSSFEVVFISSDRDQDSFEEFFSGMPWLALPFGDERRKSLSRTFRVRGIPSLVAIGPTGRTLTKDARNLLTIHGADAYPFSEERIKERRRRKTKMKNMMEGYACDGAVCREVFLRFWLVSVRTTEFYGV